LDTCRECAGRRTRAIRARAVATPSPPRVANGPSTGALESPATDPRNRSSPPCWHGLPGQRPQSDSASLIDLRPTTGLDIKFVDTYRWAEYQGARYASWRLDRLVSCR